MEFSIKISHDTSVNSENWQNNNIIKPGKKWYVPLDAINQIQNNCLKITPINNDGEEIYEKQSLNWKSNSSHELISFGQKIFIQVNFYKCLPYVTKFH